MSWFTISNIDSIDSPALLIYKERVQQNIQHAVRMVGDVSRLRPHVKTHKMAEVCGLMMEAGIYKFKCATIAEAEMLAIAGAKEVLLAYQPVGPKIHRLAALAKKYTSTSFACLVDNAAHAATLDNSFAEAGIKMNLYIDLNTGMNRTGIQPSKAGKLFDDCQQLKHVRIIGVQGYDGHIRNTDLSERKASADNAFSAIEKFVSSIQAKYAITLDVISGGSPTFPVHAGRSNIECSPGTFVFWDWGYKHKLPDEPFEFAAIIITRIISIIDEHRICVDLGHKSVASEMPFPRVHFLNAPSAEAESQSEEHLVLLVKDSSAFTLGDVLYGVPTHICPTVALYDKAFVVENHMVTGTWKVVARDRSIGE